MNIIILTHPFFFGSQSMPRFANYLSHGMSNLGHNVQVWRPRPYLYKLPLNGVIKKWLGYIDQYVIFTLGLFFKTRFTGAKNLYVLSDQALGLWAPIISSKAHVVHCHDFLALRSAKGEISENPVSFTGKLYQKLIFKGFSRAKNFISVSKNTQLELERTLKKLPKISTFVYNGVNGIFEVGNIKLARRHLGKCLNRSLENGYILHVGGNQFYKNRIGVVKIYTAWRNQTNMKVPLILIGSRPTQTLSDFCDKSKYKADILFCSGLDDEMVKYAYQGASLFLFPSLAEGFGWPIAESMACGCPVITINVAPMNEVGGDAAIYIEHPENFDNIDEWAKNASKKIEKIVGLNEENLNVLSQKGLKNIKKFNSQRTISELDQLYSKAFKLKYG